MPRLLLSFLLTGLCLTIAAQNALPIGEWRTLLSYRTGRSVTQSPDEIIYSTGSSVLLLDKKELSTRFLTRADGLSQTSIRMVRYHYASRTLIIVYENSVIDLFRDGQVRTLSQIANFNFAGGDKSINDIFIGPDGQVILAAGYGVSGLDVEQGVFLFTTFTGIPVLSAAIHDSRLYAGTAEGIYRVPLSGVNLDDFTNWTYLDEGEGFPGIYTTTAMNVWRDTLYFGIDEDIYRLAGDEPELFFDAEQRNWQLSYLSAEGRLLLAGYLCDDPQEGCEDRRLYAFDDPGLIKDLVSNCVGVTRYALEDGQGRIWLGDDWENIRVLDNIGLNDCRQLSFSGPFSDRVWQMTHDGESLWVAAGSLTPTLSPIFIDHGLFRFRDGQWTIYNRQTRPELAGPDGQVGGDDRDILTVVDAVSNPVTGKVYAASWLEGLVELDPTTEELQVYNFSNSALQVSTGAGANRTRVGGMAVDEEGTLWMTNHLAGDNRPLVALTAEGEWRNYPLCNRNGAIDVAVDANGYKWVLQEVGTGGGVVVFDEGDPATSADDRCRLISRSNANLSTNEVRSIVTDLEGDVWLGTSDGVTIFECGGNVFEASCTGTQRVVERDEFTALLLETEDVLALAVDGANRKWVGTSSGVFLLSPDGREEIHHFTTENSPLLSNTVRTIAVNDRTGEVYFGTEAGIVAYQGEATAGGRVNSAAISVFPNPVRPDYAGPIAIRGLARDANVKITDLSGKLVYETRALGGQAVWDGRDYNGRRAQTGVYLVWSTTDPRQLNFGNPDAAVARIVLVN